MSETKIDIAKFAAFCQTVVMLSIMLAALAGWLVYVHHSPWGLLPMLVLVALMAATRLGTKAERLYILIRKLAGKNP